MFFKFSALSVLLLVLLVVCLHRFRATKHAPGFGVEEESA